MAKPDDNAAKLKELEAKFAALENEFNNVKGAAAGGNDEQVPEFDRNARGNLTRKGRKQQKEWVREQRKDAREAVRQEKRERLADRQARFEEKRNESDIDKFADEGAKQADLGSVDTSGAEAAFNEKFLNAKSSIDQDFKENVSDGDGGVGSGGESRVDEGGGQDRSEKPPQVPSQPGLIKLEAIASGGAHDGDCRIFEVIGSDDGPSSRCGTGGSGTTLDGASLSNWWQPTWDSDDGELTIANGLNLHSTGFSTNFQFPTMFWRKAVAGAMGATACGEGTFSFWVKFTFSGTDVREILVADKLCNDNDEDGDFEQISGSSDTCDASIKQYYYGTGTENISIQKVTGGVQPADTNLVKYQYLGSITVNAYSRITAWDWRLNHCFYWDYMALSQGSHGDTGSATATSYSAPTSH